MTYKPIPRFNNHGKECSNHGNWMLDCEMEHLEERDLMRKVIENYLTKDETNTTPKKDTPQEDSIQVETI